MHPTKLFQTDDIAHLTALFEANPFCLVIASQSNQPVAAHTPVILDNTPTGPPLIRFHLAKTNPVTDAIHSSGRALIVATGPHDYVSPNWYRLGPDQVPTWNYLSAEAEGPTSPLSEEETETFLRDLSAKFEAGLAPKPQWTLDKFDAKKLKMLTKGIMAFRLIPDRFEGVVKLNQNKPEDARNAVAEALGDTPIARLMRDM